METQKTIFAEEIREKGKACFFDNEASPEEKKHGLELILEAHKFGDPEAAYLVSRFVMDGLLTPKDQDPQEYALSLMCVSANSGCIQARAYLNAYCEDRYHKKFDFMRLIPHRTSTLVDFDSKPIKIDRKGVFTPIDAELKCEDGQNILVLSANLFFLYGDGIEELEKFSEAVCDGLFEWGGEYEVFGGQKLTVRIELTADSNLFDNLYIVPVTDGIAAKMKAVSNVISTKQGKSTISNLLRNKRSFAISGNKWSANSRKFIYMQSKNGRFDDYEEIKNVAKHEFGHALGLGDLYRDEELGLGGVENGTYDELDSYAITNKYYNLVMCDHNGPVSNNDIEMVLLAFRENGRQNYQPSKVKGKISSALGRGN